MFISFSNFNEDVGVQYVSRWSFELILRRCKRCRCVCRGTKDWEVTGAVAGTDMGLLSGIAATCSSRLPMRSSKPLELRFEV